MFASSIVRQTSADFLETDCVFRQPTISWLLARRFVDKHLSRDDCRWLWRRWRTARQRRSLKIVLRTGRDTVTSYLLKARSTSAEYSIIYVWLAEFKVHSTRLVDCRLHQNFNPAIRTKCGINTKLNKHYSIQKTCPVMETKLKCRSTNDYYCHKTEL